ncbi:DUF3592 domain-containing protein [Salinibius halmophilus]|uniref:DUF3592 domain-containing protein n=1 Tax=Salinibius halmophilus TaxID=1853216 RepID=UPI000E6650C7|nr:DUF3592 domain-containing protein [Salinibius halmophilus]
MTSNKFGALVFGGLLLTLGVVIIATTVIAPVYISWSMRGWQQVPATLVDARVASRDVIHDDQKDSPMYYAVVEYQYEYQGRVYFGDRLDLNLLEIVNAERANHIVQAVFSASENGLSVYVNPNNPSQAIYHKQPYWRLLISMGCFGLLFILAGIGIVLLGFNKPLNNRETLLSQPKMQSHLAIFAALTLLSVYGMFAAYWLFAGLWQTVIALLLFAAPLFMSRYAWRFSSSVKRYEQVDLKLHKAVELGGRICATVTIPEPFGIEDSYQATLRCLQHHRAESQKNPMLLERWMTATNVSAQAIDGSTQLSIDIAIPHDRHVTKYNEQNSFFWLLRVRNTRSGIGFDREYEVVVEGEEILQTLAS